MASAQDEFKIIPSGIIIARIEMAWADVKLYIKDNNKKYAINFYYNLLCISLL